MAKVAIIGGGVAGIAAAWQLHSRCEVTLFESGDRIGGHTNTIRIEQGPDQGLEVDTGFIVLNDQTYPNLTDFFRELGVAIRYADMSFGFCCQRSGLEYGTHNLQAIFAQKRNAFSPRYWQMLIGIAKFWRVAKRTLGLAANDPSLLWQSLGDYLQQHGIAAVVRDDFLVPISAAIWSASVRDILKFPVGTFLNFYRNHGLLGLINQPRWQTVSGGSYRYVEAFKQQARVNIREKTPVQRVIRDQRHVELVLPNSIERFDYVVLAAHADQSLKLLQDASAAELKLLGSWSYQDNLCFLHTDQSFLPKSFDARASWNYRRENEDNIDAPVSVTYDMTRLQGLSSANRYLVTLNPRQEPDRRLIIKTIRYRHPVYSVEAMRSQEGINNLNGDNRTWYAGSYLRFGFHEDAFTAGKIAGLGILTRL